MSGNTSKIQSMHRAAEAVLENYHATGEPFALFLSSWAFDEAREIMAELMGDKRKVQVRIGLERQVRIVLKMSHLETVAIYRQGDEKRIAMPAEWPSFTYSDTEWLGEMTKLATYADLIILFWGVSTDGLLHEVEVCATEANAAKTVVISAAEPRNIFLSELPKMFPRIAFLREIPPLYPLHPEIDPLVERMKAIRATDQQIRAGFTDPKERIKRFPLPPPSGRFNGNLWIDRH